MVSLREITQSNRDAIEALRVAPGQERFVSSVSQSLREAAEHPGAHAIPWAVYADNDPVGFVMIAAEVEGSDYVPHYLWKLLIDEDHQGRGYGRETLDLIVGFFRERRGVDALTTSAQEGEGSPLSFYEHYGFERTGVVSDGEVVLRLKLNSGGR